MPLQRERHVGRRHAAAVVDHLDARDPAVTQAYEDVARARVDRIFDQLLERGRRAFDHLAGGDAIDQMLREAAY